MENSPHSTQPTLDDFTLRLSGFSRNQLIKISKLSKRLSILGLVIFGVYFFMLISGYLVFMDTDGASPNWLLPMLLQATPAFIMVFSFYHLLHFSNRSKTGILNKEEGLFTRSLKSLKQFIYYTFCAALLFIIQVVINAFYPF